MFLVWYFPKKSVDLLRGRWPRRGGFRVLVRVRQGSARPFIILIGILIVAELLRCYVVPGLMVWAGNGFAVPGNRLRGLRLVL